MMMRRLLVGLVRGYQLLFSSWMPGACRFSPSCSNYAIEAIRRHGAGAGTYLAAARIVRCGPWCAGGHDPVPVERPRLFTHLNSSRTLHPKKNS
jgi:putative membrane protein insertion efficiency factor